MKISVPVASRNSPARLETSIRVLQGLASGNNEIKYIIGCDDDDLPTGVRMQQSFADDQSVILSSEKRPVSFGSIWNRCAKLWDADAFFPLGDDQICLTRNWDVVLAEAVESLSLSYASFVSAPGAMTNPVISGAWFKASGYIFPEYFPFWFNDTWLVEVYRFIYGHHPMIMGGLLLGGKKGRTRGMRDLSFWAEYFFKLRPKRLAEAHRIAHALGMTPSVLSMDDPVIREYEENDLGFISRIPEFERDFGPEAPGPETEMYTTLKDNALFDMDYMNG